MSVKSLGALAVVGLFSATVPFYVGGHFTHQALNNQLQMLIQSESPLFNIENIQSNLGLYDSVFSYDLVVDLTRHEFAGLSHDLGGIDTARFTIENHANHGFLSVDIDTVLTDEGVKIVDKFLAKGNISIDSKDKPMMTMKSQANVALTGSYQLTTSVNMQGLKMEQVNEVGEQAVVKLSASSFEGTFDGTMMNAVSQLKELSIQTGDSRFTFADMAFTGGGEIDLNGKDIFSTFVNQFLTFDIATINIQSPDKEIEAGKDIKIYMQSNTVEDRLLLDSNFSLTKAGDPSQPQKTIEDVELKFTFDLGKQAMMDYYQAAEQLSGSPEDPKLAMEMISKLLAEQSKVKLTSGKAKTFAGPIDITANLDIAAVDPEQFKANPMVLIQSLKYAAQGEIPKTLLLASGQLPPEAIDGLIQNEMLIEDNQQIKFDMSGEKGQVNLNGKPLM